MKLHILGACGTFMAGIAYIARQLGHDVIGVDEGVYPPMSDFLQNQGITLMSSYEDYATLSAPDRVIIGNAMSRGNPAVEQVLNQGWHYISGPQWLYENVLCHKKVLAVSGTHGKTTTSSILAWILDYAGLNPGFLIGGIPKNFDTSARVTDSAYFVIEADEYDSAFFDKRSKFLHYHPDTLIVNNIEFDHADIFASLDDIKKQFHYLLRTLPGSGTLIFPAKDVVVEEMLAMGFWSKKQSFGVVKADWSAQLIHPSGQEFLLHHQEKKFQASWNLLGEHNVMNALAAVAAAHTVGVDIDLALQALLDFQNVKRRLEKIAQVNSVEIYEDFAHHPTAIQTTLQGLRRHKRQGRIVALLELGSNTMRAGVHKNSLIPSLQLADQVHILQTNLPHDFFIPEDRRDLFYHDTVDDMVQKVSETSQENDAILIMSNRDFHGIYTKLPEALRNYAQ